MKTPSEISKEGREEFEKNFIKTSIWELVPNSPRKIMTSDFNVKEMFFKIDSHILSQEIKMLESVVDWAGENKKYTGGGTKEREMIYNSAISDIQSFIQEEIEKMKI